MLFYFRWQTLLSLLKSGRAMTFEKVITTAAITLVPLLSTLSDFIYHLPLKYIYIRTHICIHINRYYISIYIYGNIYADMFLSSRFPVSMVCCPSSLRTVALGQWMAIVGGLLSVSNGCAAEKHVYFFFISKGNVGRDFQLFLS